MDQHQTVSRKFRPQLLSDVIGQEAVVTTLKNALKFGRAASAYLFSGIRGTGKTTLARIYAKALNCKNLHPETLEPCNKCASCLEIMGGNSLDVIEIDGASNRGIDDIRQINETVGYAPASGQYKIYIIDEVHMLTKEAFNALLKTLEEPPPKVKFFLATTEAHKIPSTIISRCQRFDLCRISESLIMEKLQKVAHSLNRNVKEEALYKIALFADGSLRDAESLFEQVLCYEEKEITEETIDLLLGLVPSSLFFALDEAYAKGDLSFALTLVDSLHQAGKDFGSFVQQLMDHFRNILAYKQKKDPLLQRYQKSEKIYSFEECLYILELLINADVSSKIHLEMLLIRVLQAKKRTPIEKVVAKLLELEGKLTNVQESKPLPKQEIVSEIPKKALDELPQVLAEEPKVVMKEIPFSLKPKEVEAPKAVKLEPPAKKDSVRYETLMRFAAVELEGTLKKDNI